MIQDEKPPFSFWYQQNRPAVASPSQTGVNPVAKQFEFGYDAASDMKGNIENLRGLYETGGKSTKRIARLALQPLLMAQGMPLADFDREFPPIAPDPSPVDEALLNIKTMKQMMALFAGKPEPGEG
jgi:hypothetical protein